jgi:SAM-dependent methyltransferase
MPTPRSLNKPALRLRDTPRPFLTRRRLMKVLGPEAGERILEVRPGEGYYSLGIAERLAPEGQLEVLDFERGRLEATMRRARTRGVGNVIPTQGQARDLPYSDRAFDAALACLPFGETSYRVAELSELRRVLKPEGRLVVGGGQWGPHGMPFARLQRQAAEAGLSFERRIGGPLGYCARFCPAVDPETFAELALGDAARRSGRRRESPR